MSKNTDSSLTRECAQDAQHRYNLRFPQSKAKAKIITEHMQTWSDSTLGSGGIGLCVMTEAPTIVVQVGKHLFVYHQTYQYDIDTTKLTAEQSKKLKTAKSQKSFPGKKDAHEIGGLISGKTYNEHVEEHHFNGNY